MATRPPDSRRGSLPQLSCANQVADTARGTGQIVLVLQGGGALGAYQVGVYEAMAQAGLEPDWVIGTSIGAINAALIAGNPPSERLARLNQFWETVTLRGLAQLWPAAWPSAPVHAATVASSWTTWQTITGGLPGFFAPNPPAWINPYLPLPIGQLGYYSTADLRATLTPLIDPDLINQGHPRLSVGAVNVRTGAMRYFDSARDTLSLDPILASGALPPAFPPVQVGEDHYWDGGIYSNTPVEAVFDDHPRRNSLIFSVHLWSPQGPEPTTMDEVAERQKDIQYSSRIDSHIARQAQLHRLRHVVRALSDRLPDGLLALPEVQALADHGCGTVMHLIRLMAPRLAHEDRNKDIDFAADHIAARREAGFADMRRALDSQAWLDPVDPTAGLIVHDN